MNIHRKPLCVGNATRSRYFCECSAERWIGIFPRTFFGEGWLEIYTLFDENIVQTYLKGNAQCIFPLAFLYIVSDNPDPDNSSGEIWDSGSTQFTINIHLVHRDTTLHLQVSRYIQLWAPLRIRCCKVKIDRNARYMYFKYIGWKGSFWWHRLGEPSVSINKHIYVKSWVAPIRSCWSVARMPLNLGHGWMITYHWKRLLVFFHHSTVPQNIC